MKSSGWSNLVKAVTKDWKKKLAALALSGLLFYFVQNLSFTEQSVVIPVRIEKLPSNLVILDTSDPGIPVTVRARTEQFRLLDLSGNVALIADLEYAQPGTSNYKVELRVETPIPDMKITPQKDKVSFTIDRIVEKELPIKPVITGTPRQGYIMDDIIMDRRSITVSGPLSVLLSNTAVETLPIDISDATNTISQLLSFHLPRGARIVGNTEIRVVVGVVQREEAVTNN